MTTGSLAKRAFSNITLTVDDLKDIAEVMSEISSTLSVHANGASLGDLEDVRQIAQSEVVIDSLTMVTRSPEAELELSWEPGCVVIRLMSGGVRSQRTFGSLANLLANKPRNDLGRNIIDLSVASGERRRRPPPSAPKLKSIQAAKPIATQPRSTASSALKASRTKKLFSRWWGKLSGS